MKAPPSPSDQDKPSFIARFFRWLFSWRTFRRALVALVGLITLLALLWTEENLRGKHDWDKYKHEWEAKGEHFDFASVVPPAVPDDQNFFMAPIWAGTLNQKWEPDAKTGEFRQTETNVVDELRMTLNAGSGVKEPETGGSWQKHTLTDLKQWQEYYRRSAAVTNYFPVPAQPRTPASDVLLALSRYDSVVEALRQAGQRPGSQVPLDYSNLSTTVRSMLPLFSDLKSCIRVLQLRAIAELADSQNAKALDDVKLMLRLTDSIRNQPFLISHLVRLAMMNIALQPIYEGLAEHRWTDAQLAELESALAGEDFLADYEFAMRGERAYGISMLNYLTQYHGLNPFYHQWQLAAARMFQQWIFPCVNVETRVVWPEQIRQLHEAEATEWKHTTPYNVLAKMLFPAVSKAPIKFAIIQSGVDQARIACALERYHVANGKYPGALDALVPRFIDRLPSDVINGKPLHYRSTDSGQFILYSVGWNETDDGGQVLLNKYGTPDLEKGDWVWQMPAR